MSRKTPVGHAVSVNKYMRNKYDRVEFIVPKGLKAKLREYAEKNNTSVNALLNQYIITIVDDVPDIIEEVNPRLIEFNKILELVHDAKDEEMPPIERVKFREVEI